MLSSSSLRNPSSPPTPFLSLLWPSPQSEVNLGDPDLSLCQTSQVPSLVSTGCPFRGSDHLKDIHMFPTDPQNLDLLLAAYLPHRPCLSFPNRGSSAIPHRPPHHTTPPFVRIRMVTHRLRVQHWATHNFRFPLCPSMEVSGLDVEPRWPDSQVQALSTTPQCPQ